MRKRVTLVDRNGMGDTVAGVEDDTGRSARSVEREYGLCYVWASADEPERMSVPEWRRKRRER